VHEIGGRGERAREEEGVGKRARRGERKERELRTEILELRVD